MVYGYKVYFFALILFSFLILNARRAPQALNQFDADRGWVAYVTPTRALTAQITRHLRRDFSPMGITVEQLTGAVEIDSFEEILLAGEKEQKTFDILVATPEN